MASTIVVPSAAQIGAHSPEVAATMVNHTMEPEAAIARALIAIANAAVVDIEALQTGGGGGGGPAGATVWIVDSSAASSEYANGLRYVPLRNAQNDTVAFQLVAASTGTLTVSVRYAMSAAEANGVRLRFDVLTLGLGGNPTTAQTTGTAFTVTTSNDVLLREITTSDSGDLDFAVTAGDIVYGTLTRLGSDGADTHSGDMRIIEFRLA